MTPEAAKKLLALRRSTDPCHQFPTHMSPTQAAFWACRSRCQLIEGPNQSGKTITNLVKFAAILRGIHPDFPLTRPIKAMVLAPSRLQASQVFRKRLFEDCELVIPGVRGKPLIPKSEIAKLREMEVGFRTPISLKLKNGSEVIFAWSGTDKTWERIQGITCLDLAVLDEDAGGEDLMAEIQARQLVARSDTTMPWAGMTLWSSTPTTGSIALDLYRDFCLQAEKQGDHRAYKLFRIEKSENPAVSAEAREDYAKSLSQDQADIRVHGVKSKLDTLSVYPGLEATRHVAPTPHVLQPTDNIWVVLDPGWDHAFGMLAFVVSQRAPEQVRVVRFWAMRHTPTKDVIRELAVWLDGRFVECIVVDPAADSDRGGVGQTRLQQIEEAIDEYKIESRQGLRRGANRRDYGIPLVEQYIDEGKLLFDPEPEGVINGCALAWQQMTKYRKKVTAGKVTGTANQPDEAADCIRYGLSKRPVYDAQPLNHPTGAGAKLALPPAEAAAQALADEPTETDDQRLWRERVELNMRLLDDMEGDFNGGYKRVVASRQLLS